MKRTKYTVTYADRVAKFSSYADAMEWAKYVSGMSGHLVEVAEKEGLVGQFDDGVLTLEFEDRTWAA